MSATWAPQSQRGGRGTVRTWLVTLLILAGLGSAYANVVQYELRKRTIAAFVVVANQVLAQCHAPAPDDGDATDDRTGADGSQKL